MKKSVTLIITFCLLANFNFAQQKIAEVFPDLHRIHKWDNSVGDTWDPFWADDDNLYAFNCDGRGFGTADKTSNLSLNLLRGYTVETLEGSMLNRMAEYGISNEKKEDNATWKVLGHESIDGVFYAFVSRHTYGYASGDHLQRQTARNASLIKSTDKGITWTRTAAENYDNPMWPGSRFGAPFFVHYGKNGGQVTKDKADKYVYAISNNGFWNNGDDYIIGRILRTKLPDMKVSDWQYFTGGDAKLDSNWNADINKASAILSLPAQCGSGPATYIPALEKYIMVAWHTTERLPTWFDPTEMKYDFYQADHPWGPWEYINSLSDKFLPDGQHMYGPSICTKFQETNGSEVKVTMFTSGCSFEDQPKSIYKLWQIPLILRTNKSPEPEYINNDNKLIKYTGNWNILTKQRDANYKGDIHYSSSKNDFLEFSFNGTGIEYLAQKDWNNGKVEVYINEKPIETVDLKIQNFPRISGIVVSRISGLPKGNHKIKLVNVSNQVITFDAFKIF